jgi:hypothetical protein
MIWSSANLNAVVITSTWFFPTSLEEGLFDAVSTEKDSSILGNPFWLAKAG